MATTNAGRPTIGRTATRSTPSASTAVQQRGQRQRDAEAERRRPGRSTSTAPASMNAGWAKLITRVAL